MRNRCLSKTKHKSPQDPVQQTQAEDEGPNHWPDLGELEGQVMMLGLVGLARRLNWR